MSSSSDSGWTLSSDHSCFFRTILESLPDGVVVFNKRGKTIYCNSAMVSISGVEQPASMFNTLSRDFLAEPERDLPLIMEQLQEDNSVVSHEVRVPERWRPLEWVELSIRTVTLEGKTCYLATVRDVGRRLRLMHERERVIAVQRVLNELILEGSLEDMLTSACSRLAVLYAADWVGVALLGRDEKGEFFKYQNSFKVPSEIEAIRFPRDGTSSLTAFAAEHGYRSIRDYQSTFGDDIPRREVSLRAKVRAVESVSLRDRHGQLIGVLSLFSSTPGFFKEGENEISLTIVARDLANIIEAKQLEEEIRKAGITDGLTGLYNTRHFYRRLQEEMKRSHRSGRPLTVMIFDLDNFKEYNDRAGHVAGDHLLRRIADIVRATIRKGSDLAFRYGGDEFVVLLPETDLSRARRVAGRIRKGVRNVKIADVSVSVGLAGYRGEASPEELVRRADRAMYKAKERGKNRVVVDRPNRGGTSGRG